MNDPNYAKYWEFNRSLSKDKRVGATKYTAIACLLVAFVLTRIEGVTHRQIRDAQCSKGNAHACDVAKQWGYDPKDKPVCPEGCICIPPHGYPICG